MNTTGAFLRFFVGEEGGAEAGPRLETLGGGANSCVGLVGRKASVSLPPASLPPSHMDAFFGVLGCNGRTHMVCRHISNVPRKTEDELSVLGGVELPQQPL